MRKYTLLVMMMAFAAMADAQVGNDWAAKAREEHDKAMEGFQQFRQQVYQDYESFRRQINADYAAFMEEAWSHFDSHPKEELPWAPKPPQPVVAEPETHPTATPIPFDGKPVAPKPIEEQPQPVEPIVYNPRPQDMPQTVFFYGTPLTFHVGSVQTSLRLADASEKSVAALWKQLSEPAFDNLVAECLGHREARNLSDWAYVMLTEQVAELVGKGHTNEAVVLHMFLLTQSGYQVRMARADNGRLCVLIGSHEKIYHYKYFVIDGVNYYNFDRSLEDRPMSIFDHAFPKEKTLSLRMNQPKLAVDLAEPRTIVSKRYPNVSVTVEMNKNLIDFYNNCPLSAQWGYYSATSLSETAKASLYPALRRFIEGKSQAEAANIMINLIQTGFRYATDQEQFGYERPLYPDETFFYPYCDCEDRAILYACLVRELMGLDVVLLNYPGHLASAVCFTEEVTGDYLMLDGKKYIICDPTYIGAAIGRCMPDYKEVMPKVVYVR